MYHAVPSSGILCIELLKNSHSRTSNLTSPSQSFPLPISEMVQNLSLLVGFLDWVKPSQPNSELCYRIRDIIRRVLNQALDQPKETVDEVGDRPWDMGIEMDFNLTEFEDYANFELLDGYDWIGEPWVPDIGG
jgi:hypothetical protein